jgi:hypothetical protein
MKPNELAQQPAALQDVGPPETVTGCRSAAAPDCVKTPNFGIFAVVSY